MSFVYIKSESELWTAGHYAPGGKWVAESDHRSEEGAAARCNYLNGAAPAAAPGAASDPLCLAELEGVVRAAKYTSGLLRCDGSGDPEFPCTCHKCKLRESIATLDAARAKVSPC